MVSSFLPVPLSGAFGAAQVSTVQGAGTLYEKTSVVGVLRVLPQPSGPTSGEAGGSSSNSSSNGSGDGSGAAGTEQQ